MPVVDSRERFSSAFRSYYRPIVQLLHRRLGNLADAEEVATATFLVAWRCIDEMPAEPDTLRWLHGVSRRTVLNHIRGEARWGDLIAKLAASRPVQVLEDPTEDGDGERDVLGAFDTLTPSQQEVLRLVDSGVSTEEAAALLGCKPGAFHVRVHRARAALRRALDTIEVSVPAE